MRTVFRKDRDTGEIVCLWPDKRWSLAEGTCVAYRHFGQHHAAIYDFVISNTDPAGPQDKASPKDVATPEDYADLYRELIDVGYTPEELEVEDASDPGD